MQHELSAEILRQMIVSSLETIEVYEASIKNMHDLLTQEKERLHKLQAYMDRPPAHAH